jgi:hypothetical protein
MGIDSVRKRRGVINLAIRVKENTHTLREIGLIFFALALFTGLIWITGKDVEPIAFVLGSISTLLYISPTLARYVQPDDKPVRTMSYDEILDFISASDARHDWKWVKTNLTEEAFLKADPRLRFMIRHDDNGIHVKSFKAPWLDSLSKPASDSYWCDLSYDGGLLHRFVLVPVDGGKAQLPVPDQSTGEVGALDYKVAQIFDENNTLAEYMSSTGLMVSKAL